MKSFKEYLAEQEQQLIVENEWNFNIPKTRMFETDQKNQTAAKNIMTLALGKGNSHAEAYEAIKAKAAAGEEIKTGEKEVDDILQALSVLSTIATKKNSPAYKLLTPREAKGFLEKAGVKAGDDGKYEDNPAVNVGKKIITTKRKNPEPEPEVDGEEEPKAETPKVEAPKAETPKVPEIEEPEGEEESNEEEKDDDAPDATGSDKTSDDTEKDKSSDDTKKSKDVDLESDNSRSPDAIAKRAQKKVDEILAKLESQKEGLSPEKAAIIDKTIINFKKKANTEINNIKKQQNGFSVHATPASRLKATTKAENFYQDLKMQISKAEYDSGKVFRTNALQRAGMRMKEAGEGLARGVKRVTDSKKFQDTKDAMGRAINKTKEVGGKAIAGAAEGISRTAKMAVDSKTAQEIKAATGRVWDKIKTKAAETDEKVAAGVSKIAQPKTAEVMKDKIEDQPDNTIANTTKSKEATKLVMSKATMQKVLPGQGTPKAPLVAKKKKKEEETDEEGNIIHKSKVV